jgi:hypothetical protein
MFCHCNLQIFQYPSILFDHYLSKYKDINYIFKGFQWIIVPIHIYNIDNHLFSDNTQALT